MRRCRCRCRCIPAARRRSALVQCAWHPQAAAERCLPWPGRVPCRTMDFTYEEWEAEIAGQRDWLNHTCGVPAQ